MKNLPRNAMCETDLLRTAPADPATPAVPRSRKGLTVRAVSTRTSCERVAIPADLYFAGVTLHVQDGASPERRYVSRSCLGDVIAAAPSLEELDEPTRAWLGTNYYHQRRWPDGRKPVIFIDDGDGEQVYDYDSGTFRKAA